MFKSSAKSLASTTSDSKTIDLVVVLAAGLFFANIVLGSDAKQEPLLAYAVEIETCGTSCAYTAN